MQAAAIRSVVDEPPVCAGLDTLHDPLWKRVLDLAVASALLVLTSPVWALAALLIKFDSQGPALFAQTAVGKGGREFRYYKFRTMAAGNDNGEHRAYVRAFVLGRAQTTRQGGGEIYKIIADPRLTRVGKWLRRLSVDELPQLLNVLKGDMSLVGPRPPLPYEYELYDERAARRLAVRPGITGLYQITGRNRVPFKRMVEIDLDYVERRSLWLDLSIMLWTPAAMARGRGAY